MICGLGLVSETLYALAGDPGPDPQGPSYGLLEGIDGSPTEPPPSQAPSHYYEWDGHNSVRFLSDASGTVSATCTYDAFGTQIASTGTTTNNYRYTSEQWDQDLGMYYLRARYYSPQIGRFWTMDSYEGDNQDPLSLHKYLYSQDNPINRIDPSGHFDFINPFSLQADLTIAGSVSGRKVTTRVLLKRLSPLSKKLLEHYMDGTGTRITLTEAEMADCSVTIDLRRKAFRPYQEQLSLTSQNVLISGVRMLLEARNANTLFHFTGIFNGTLTGTSKTSWHFQGTVNFKDSFDYESQDWNVPNTRSYDENARDPGVEFMTRGANFWIPGKKFLIDSVAAPISQSANQVEATWAGTGRPTIRPAFF